MSKLEAENLRNNLILPDVVRWTAADGPIISLANIDKRFGDKLVLDDLSLDIPVGKTTVIIGESGSGKSVLLKTMNGLMMPTSGSSKLFGVDLSSCDVTRLNALRKRTGMILQDYALIDSITVFENVAFPIVEHSRLGRARVRELVEAALEPIGLLDAIDKLPSELSGGMKKRVSFARAIIHQPELVLFDEPTTGLDPLMIVFVDEIIQHMRRQYDITSVIISHDIQSIQRLADKIAFLHAGKIIFEGSFAEVQACQLPEVRRFFEAENAEDKPDSVGRHRNAVEIRDLYKSFGDHEVLKGISLDIPERKISVIIGGSGSGKSVLLKHVLGLFRPNSGSVKVGDLELTECTERELETFRTQVGMLFQGSALFDSITVEENVAFPLAERIDPPSKAEIQRRVDEILERLKLTDIAKSFPADISAGQRKRVGLARAIITRPSLMIYDEPTTGQDPIMIRYVDDMILEAHSSFELTTIVISHDMVSTFRIADQVAMVYQGQILASGSPAKLLADPNPVVQDMIRAQIPVSSDKLPQV